MYIKISTSFLNKAVFFICSFYLLTTNIKASSDVSEFTAEDYVKEYPTSVLPGTYKAIKDSMSPGLVIGRGNKQGIDTTKIIEPSLKKVNEWFYLDPIAAHHTPLQTLHSIIAKWPNTELAAALLDRFNAVIFDFRVLDYLGETRQEGILCYAKSEEIMNLAGEGARRDYTGSPSQYQKHMHDAFPDRVAEIEARYTALLNAAAEKKQAGIEEGIRSAFAVIKPKGHLFVPIESCLARLNKSTIATILGIPCDGIEEKSVSFATDMSDSPLLPEIEKGDGFSYKTFNWLVISKT